MSASAAQPPVNDANQQQQQQSGKAINTCVKCGKNSKDLHLCVHCTNSLCYNCRKEHVDEILGEYTKNRKDAKEEKLKCEEIIKVLDQSGVALSSSYSKAEVQIKEAFDKLEEALKQRKLELVSSLRTLKDEEMKRLKKGQKEVEADVGVTTRKLDHNCGTQAKSIQHELGVKYKLLDDAKFAHLCSLEFKSRECLNDFVNTSEYCKTKDTAEKVYFDQEQLPDLIGLIGMFGEVTLGKKQQQQNDGQN